MSEITEKVRYNKLQYKEEVGNVDHTIILLFTFSLPVGMTMVHLEEKDIEFVKAVDVLLGAKWLDRRQQDKC
jgi:hypothetical protein